MHYLDYLIISRSIVFDFSASVVKCFILKSVKSHDQINSFSSAILYLGTRPDIKIIESIGHFVSRTTKIVVPRLSFQLTARAIWQIQDGGQQSWEEGILIKGNTFELRYPVFTSKYLCIIMSFISLCLAFWENSFICHLILQETMVLEYVLYLAGNYAYTKQYFV